MGTILGEEEEGQQQEGGQGNAGSRVQLGGCGWGVGRGCCGSVGRGCGWGVGRGCGWGVGRGMGCWSFRRAIPTRLGAPNGEGVKLGVDSEQRFPGTRGKEELVHGRSIVDDDIALLLAAVDAAHDDHPVLLLRGSGPRHKDGLGGEEPCGQLLLDGLSCLHIKLDHRTVQLEHVVGEVAKPGPGIKNGMDRTHLYFFPWKFGLMLENSKERGLSFVSGIRSRSSFRLQAPVVSKVNRHTCRPCQIFIDV